MNKKENKIKWLLDLVKNSSQELKSIESFKKNDFGQDAIKVIFHREKFRHFLLGQDEKITPITFEVWPSLTCDARCPLCTTSQNYARFKADKTNELFIANKERYERFFQSIYANGVKSIILTGGGEPTLHPDLCSIVSYAYNAGLKWGMFTHGMNLNEEVIHSLFKCKPRFIRISVNAGNEKSHFQEYRINEKTYQKVKQNIILAANISKKYSNKAIVLGYALNGKISDNELIGVKNFIEEIYKSTDGAIQKIAFRPKTINYDKNGNPRKIQPFAKELETLPERISNLIIKPLKVKFDKINLDFKKGAFLSIIEEYKDTPLISSGWAGFIDHKAKGYIISEVSGSPWLNSSYSSFNEKAPNSFNDFWFHSDRVRIMELYENGTIQAPHTHKLAHLNKLLLDIRENVNTLTEDEVDLFYLKFDELNITPPRNWDFI